MQQEKLELLKLKQQKTSLQGPEKDNQLLKVPESTKNKPEAPKEETKIKKLKIRKSSLKM